MSGESPETIRLSLGNLTLDVPVHGSRAQTIKLADRVNEQLRLIEGQSSRIDSQAFALQAALHFAAEAERVERLADQLQREHEAETREMIRAVESLTTALREILRTIE